MAQQVRHVATNVGASLLAMRRAGGARSHRRGKPNGVQ